MIKPRKEQITHLLIHFTFQEQKNDGAGFFDFGGQDEDGDDMLLGGALEPEGHETVEANGGRVHYLLEEEIHEDDLDIGGSHNISDGQGVESNGHSLTSKFAENLNIKHHVEVSFIISISFGRLKILDILSYMIS